MTKVWTQEHWTDYEQGIVATEREKVVKWMTAKGYATGDGNSIEDLLKELEWQIEDRIKNIIQALDCVHFLRGST